MSIFLAAGLGAHCGPYAPALSPESEMSVVTFNMLHGVRNEDARAEPYDRFPERLPLVADALKERRPAVLMLQETYFGWLTGYPDVRRVLKAQLDVPGDAYQSVFASYLGAGVMFNGGAGIGQTTLTRWPILEAHRFAVPGDLRIVLHVRVASGQEVIDTYNVHLEGSRQEGAQAAEIRSVLGFIESTADPNGSVVVGGDFNSTDDEIAHRLMREAGFIDVGAASGLRCDDEEHHGCTNSNFPLDTPGFRSSRRIDFLYLRSSNRAHTRAAPIFDQPVELPNGGVLWPSDHIGVSADF
ncbi:MAG: endonuclease/exonuclease/phosphatase family protein [Myxococcaceae bacterium]|nr:endonuclease/exonuclease/phosphatase family protein [Myxococcaceae bacterium]